MSEMEQGWSDRARYDLETARVMLASGRYLYVVFCCQQAVEKALKAVIVRKTGALPPRVHNLLRLADSSITRELAEDVMKNTEQVVRWVLSIRT